MLGNDLADDVPVDRWRICRFTPPSNVMIEVGVAHVGQGGYDAPNEHRTYAVVVGQVRGGDALEAAHPLLEPPVVRVGALDVPGATRAHAAVRSPRP